MAALQCTDWEQTEGDSLQYATNEFYISITDFDYRTEFISINLYKVLRLKYNRYMHNITRDSRKKEDIF